MVLVQAVCLVISHSGQWATADTRRGAEIYGLRTAHSLPQYHQFSIQRPGGRTGEQIWDQVP